MKDIDGKMFVVVKVFLYSLSRKIKQFNNQN